MFAPHRFAWPLLLRRLARAARVAAAVSISLAVCGSKPASAIIVLGAQGRNTDPVTTAPAGSGYQYEGIWSNVLGTAIAPHYFVTAAHTGGTPGDLFTLGGVSYTTTSHTTIAGTDLAVWQVTQTIPAFAPLYNGSGEVTQNIVVYGRGVQSGDPLIVNGAAIGWNWGAYDGAESWGANQVDGVVNAPGLGDLLTFSFNGGTGPNEGILSPYDSGGGLFVDNNGTWQLAGVNYGVQVFYAAPPATGRPTAYSAAIYDARGLYEDNGDGTFGYIDPATNVQPVPQAAAASRIAGSAAQIAAITGTGGVAPEPAAALLGAWGLPLVLLWARRTRRGTAPLK